VLREAGIKYRWYDCRHTFVTRLAENPNVSEQTIRALAGHVSKQMLERYSHIRREAKLEAITALERGRLENLPEGGTKMGTISKQRERENSQDTERFGCPPGIRTPIC
jgi:hypothetical protein